MFGNFCKWLGGCLLVVILLFALGIGGCIYFFSGKVNSFASHEDEEEYEEEFSFQEVFMGGSKKQSDDLPRIAVININGIIVSDSEDSFSGRIASARQICARIRKAGADPNVVALIVNLNTPGGEVTASDVIYDELLQFRKKGKPAVAMMNSMACSGGYYIASACHPIIAHRSTMTGSIGVILSTYNYKGFFDKLGLKSEIYASGKMKDMLNGARERTPEETLLVKQLVENTYLDFAKIVSSSRKIPLEKITGTEIGDGRIFDGVQAMELGLVDSLGYFRDAVNAAAGQAKLPKNSFAVIRYENAFSFARILSFLESKTQPVRLSLEGESFSFRPKGGQLYFLPGTF